MTMMQNLRINISKRQLCCGMFLASVCLMGITGCGKNDADMAQSGGKAPAPAPSVDLKSVPDGSRQHVQDAIAQGKFEQSRGVAEGNAYMADMKRIQNK